MKILLRISLVGLWCVSTCFLLFGSLKKNTESDLFTEIIKSNISDANESFLLDSKAKRKHHEVSSSYTGKQDYLYIYTRRMPRVFSKRQKMEVVSIQAGNGILSVAATQSKAVLKNLDSFKYPKVLIDYAGERLFSKVSGKISGLMERKRFFENKTEFGIFVRLPREQVDLTTIGIISENETRSFYSIAVARLAQKAISENKFDDAMNMLLESLKYGNNSEGLFVSLYKCYVKTGNEKESEKLSLYLQNRFGKDIDFDETLELAVLAENAKLIKQSNFWYTKAERFFGLPPSVDFLNTGESSK